MTDIRTQIAAALNGHPIDGRGPACLPQPRFIDWQNCLKLADAILSIPGIAVIHRADFQQLMGVAELYVNAFSEDELMTLPERMRLQRIENIVAALGYATEGKND